MPAKEVYALRSDFQQLPFKNLTTNLKNLWGEIENHKQHMIQDCVAYGNDVELLKALHQGNDENIPWHRSTVCKLLKEDIAAGGNKTMKPRNLHSTREEYMIIDLKTFRNWIY
eukprot:14173038-Ditylum_brightwellii.AAC.1